jgi:hypothetical protein
MEHWWNETDKGKRNYWEINCLRVTLTITNITWTGLGKKSGLSGERTATKGTNHATALKIKIDLYYIKIFSLYFVEKTLYFH